MGYKNMKFVIHVDGGSAREVQKRWQEWFQSNSYPNIDDIDGEIKVYCERKPSREARDKLFGRLKAVARHEFGHFTTKGHPNCEIEIDLQDAGTIMFAKLDRYSDDVVFGEEALAYLGWDEAQAQRRVRSFHY